MRCTFGKTLVSMHPLLPALWGIAILSGGGASLFPALLSLILHECGHILAAKCFGQRIEALEITPLGGILTLSAPESLSPVQAFLAAGAGPAFSLLSCFAAPFLYRQCLFPFSFVSVFLKNSALLFFINLLPALPLDGGRMAQALIATLFPDIRPRRFLFILGAAAGCALCGISVYFAIKGQLILAPLFAGLYLFYAAGVENRQEPYRHLTALIGRRQKLDQEQFLPVQFIAAGGETQIKKLLRCLSPGKYHIILVLSPDGAKLLGIVDDSAYYDAVLANESRTLGQICQNPLHFS